MKLYTSLAKWWSLLSPVEEYEEEADLLLSIIFSYKKNLKEGLELGSGGGSNAFYFKNKLAMTLLDASSDMLKISKKLNPECPHHLGDMRDADLAKKFDLVFIHDAICHIQTKKDLTKVFLTAKRHLKDDGLLLIVPDFLKETFKQDEIQTGGTSRKSKGIRFLEWSFDKNPRDNVVNVEYVYLLKEKNQCRVERDSITCGIFSKKDWQKQFEQIGFRMQAEEIAHSELTPQSLYALVGVQKKNEK